jgi:hypothetical protein
VQQEVLQEWPVQQAEEEQEQVQQEEKILWPVQQAEEVQEQVQAQEETILMSCCFAMMKTEQAQAQEETILMSRCLAMKNCGRLIVHLLINVIFTFNKYYSIYSLLYNKHSPKT